MANPRDILNTFEPYSVYDYKTSIKLDANESPYNLPQSLLDEFKQNLGDVAFNRYPDPLSDDLRSKIAERTGLSNENIFIGNGGDEAIYYAYMAFGGAGRRAVTFGPTFTVYGLYAALTSTDFVDISRNSNFDIDFKQIDQAVAQNPDILFLCNPNNPTGTGVSASVIDYLITKLPDCLIVLDEAYGEFSGTSQAGLISKKNVAVLKTFSKAFSLAGMRVGYLLADQRIINAIMKVKLPFNVNILSQRLASLCLKYEDNFLENQKKIIEGRDYLMAALKEIPGIEPFDSQANYILFRSDKDAKDVFDELIKRDILIRSFFNDPRLEGCLRVTVGSDFENEKFVSALKEIMGVS